MKRLIEKLYLEGKLKDEYNTPGYVAPPRTYPPSAPLAAAANGPPPPEAFGLPPAPAPAKRLPRTTAADEAVLARVKAAEEVAAQKKAEEETAKRRAAEAEAARKEAAKREAAEQEAVRKAGQQAARQAALEDGDPAALKTLAWELPHLLTNVKAADLKSSPHQCARCGKCFGTPLLKRTHEKSGSCSDQMTDTLCCVWCDKRGDCASKLSASLHAFCDTTC